MEEEEGVGVNRLMMGGSSVRGTNGGEEGSYPGRRNAGGQDGQGDTWDEDDGADG